MNRNAPGKGNFIQVSVIVNHSPLTIQYCNFLLDSINGEDYSQVTVEDFAVVVVGQLDNA